MNSRRIQFNSIQLNNMHPLRITQIKLDLILIFEFNLAMMLNFILIRG